MRHSRLVLLAMAMVLAGATPAAAHAFLERADPRVGSTVHTAPTIVRLWFTEAIEPAFSSVRVVTESGKQVDRGDAQVDPSTPKLLRVSLPPLPAGAYKVFWRAVSTDSHVTEGEFAFRIAP